MDPRQIAFDLINWGVDFAFLVPFFFPAYIRIIWAWEKDEWGWNIVLLDLAVSIALLPSFVHRVFGTNVSKDFFIWLIAISIWLIPIIVIWRSVMIWKKQRKIDTKEEEK